MPNKIAQLIANADSSRILFGAFAAILLSSLFIGIATEWYFLAGLPAFFLLFYLSVADFRKVFYLLLLTIPLSTEIYLPNGFGTDIPTEPLMVGLMIVFFLYTIKKGREFNMRFFRHPITLLLLLQLGWILITTITSSSLLVSVKFSLAKIWYVVTLYFLASLFLKNEKDLRIFFWLIFIPLLFTVLITFARHSAFGFRFEFIHKVLSPFYRNHVIYASIISVFLPFLWFSVKWYKDRPYLRWGLIASVALFLFAIQLSYTRAAYVAVFIAFGAYYIIRLKWTKYVVILALVCLAGMVAYLSTNNKYLDYAPNYETTVTHYNFNSLIEATYQMEDISTMERLYRWVAGVHMSLDKPLFGFGPGNFYGFYKPFTVSSFKTYVSGNPERSGIHSYFLMVLTEQGYIGLGLFSIFVIYVLLKGEAIYHRVKDPQKRRIVMTSLLSMVVILSLLIINDLIETDKIGPFFFMNLAILVNMDLSSGEA